MKPFRRGLTRISLVLTWLGMLLSANHFIGCSAPGVGSSATDERALKVWRMHEAAVEQAIKGKQDEEKFASACLFFEQVAGIHIHVNIFTLGLAPEPEAAKDLELIQDWYAANRSRLYWDAATMSVKLRPSD